MSKSKGKLKQVRGKNQGTKEAAANWKLLNEKYSGKSKGDQFIIADGHSDEWQGFYWEQIMNWRKYHPDQPVVNILAITGKSTRKSTIFAEEVIERMSQEPYLFGIGARDTDDRSKSDLDELFTRTKDIMITELDLDFLEEVLTKGNGTWWFIRDPKRKDNKNIQLTSFEKIVKKGGFVKPVITLWDELVNPDATPAEIPNREEFLYGMKLINTKNRENFLSAGKDYKKFATNLFAMNRWVDNHPLVEFAEEHFPFKEVEKQFMEDPLNSNFAVKYIGIANKGWKDMNETLIVYASKFSNDMIINDIPLREQLIEELEMGSQRDKGIIIGSVFEGAKGSDKVYQFAPEDWWMHEELPKKPLKVATSTDYDYNEEIVLHEHYLMCFDEPEVIEEFGHKVYAVITKPIHPLITKNMPQDGKGVLVEEWVVDKMIQAKTGVEVEVDKMKAYHDNDQGGTIDNYNNPLRQDLRRKHKIYSSKPTKHGWWDIIPRVKFTNKAVPLGFWSLMENKAAKRVKREFHNCKVQPGTKGRDERPGKQKLNIINTMEYGVAPWSRYMSKFPTGFWEWWNKNMIGK